MLVIQLESIGSNCMKLLFMRILNTFRIPQTKIIIPAAAQHLCTKKMVRIELRSFFSYPEFYSHFTHIVMQSVTMGYVHQKPTV